MADAAYEQIFKIFDEDRNGTLDREECALAFRTCLELSNSDIQSMLDEADENKDGTVSLQEFCKVMSKWLTEDKIPDLSHLQDFCSLDKDKSGFLSGDELVELFKKTQPDKSAEEIDALVSSRQNQQVCYLDYLSMMQK